MKKLIRRTAITTGLFIVAVAFFLSFAIKQHAQTGQSRSGYINDFAGVLSDATKQQLENLLNNFKQKTGIDFAVVTVQTTAGQDVSDYSMNLAREWNVGARTSTKKSLLLVVAVNEKASFTRFSRGVQSDLPEGVLGDMGQRMHPYIDAGQMDEALTSGVKHLVSAVAEKLAFDFAELEKSPAVSESAPQATSAETNKPADQANPAVTVPVVDSQPSVTKTAVGEPSAPVRTRRAVSTTTADDEAEAEEVELTLTKPLSDRVPILKAFLDTHPNSKARERAIELLISAHAALGDDRLKNGDRAGGLDELALAISEAPPTVSDKLFAGVISQIPLNLYLRGEAEAAVKAARAIEAKFGSDPKRLLKLSSFYLSTEQGAEAVRLSTQAVQLAPDLAEAHQGLARALHISLRIDDAIAEYKKAVELDANLKTAQLGLADMYRASGKTDDALTLYRQLTDADANDKAARNGLILSLFESGKTEEAKATLQKALDADPRNVSLLASAAYWFAAHNDASQALSLAQQAVTIEPRYTWSEIALARALIAQRQPAEAERAVRFARQYGKFPTLEYELANVLASLGLYDEAAQVLAQTFTLQNGQIGARLGGQVAATNESFLELLAPERRASIFQYKAADTEANAKQLKALLAFSLATDPDANGGTLNEQAAIAAARDFVTGDDASRVHRELFAATRLLQRDIAAPTAFELAEAARSSADAGLTVPELTVVLQADELRAVRARSIASGSPPQVPEAPRNVLSNLLRGRIEDVSGWALIKQDKFDDAVDHLRRAIAVLPQGTPAARNAYWHLGVALEGQNKQSDALSSYIKSYTMGEPDPSRRVVIEQLYRKVNGSLDGLNEKLGEQQTTVSEAPATAGEPQPSPAAPTKTEEPSPTPSSSDASDAQHSALTPAAANPSPADTVEKHAEPTPSPTPAPTPETSSPSLSESPVEKMLPAPKTTLTITGKVVDGNGNAVANVVVVLISAQGTVIASTTDDKGNFSFNVATSSTARSYRVIPSKDGFAFEPVDRVLPVTNEDIKQLSFVARPAS